MGKLEESYNEIYKRLTGSIENWKWSKKSYALTLLRSYGLTLFRAFSFSPFSFLHSPSSPNQKFPM
jgi:hypothetical protein